ncbi:MAG TPA: hypothetical protein VEC37_04665 [Bacillota bacterium]|nr:hypothetical protein [Bacillota bacterium]
MNYFEVLSQAAQANPQRHPGSPGAATVLQSLKNLASGLNLAPETLTLPVYRFQNSLWGWIGIGLICILSGYAFPLASLAGSILLLVLLFSELSQPLLGKFKSLQAENLIVNLPAKNKETQKVFLVANFDSEAFSATPGNFNTSQYLTAIFTIAAVIIFCSIGYFFSHLAYFNHFNLLLLILVGVLNIGAKQHSSTATLKNCAALLETAALLSKVKPDITSVTLCYSGSRSLNSGMLALLPEFAKGPNELTYVVNLAETADTAGTKLQIVASEGMIQTKNANQLLVSALKEVAREKSLSIETVNTPEFTETYPLNRTKVNPLTILIPQNESVSIREVRELICGLIRKMDH